MPGDIAISPAQRERQAYARIGRERVAVIVDDFYDRIRRHPTLAAPFAVVADWDEHKARLTHFWWVSLGGPAYRTDRYRVAEKHLPVGLSDALIDDWLALFRHTLHAHLPADLADLWYARAHNMGISLRMMSEFYARKAERPPAAD